MFEFYELTSGSIIELLKNEVAEVGIVRLPGMTPAFLTEQLRMEQRLCAYGRRDNPWVSPQAGSVAVSSLERRAPGHLQGLRPHRGRDTPAGGRGGENFQRVHLKNEPHDVGGEGAAIAVICAGEASQEEDGEMFCLPLSSRDADTERLLHAHRSVVTVKGRGLSAAAERFVDYCQKNQAAIG
jgi:hypothetical protein